MSARQPQRVASSGRLECPSFSAFARFSRGMARASGTTISPPGLCRHEKLDPESRRMRGGKQPD
jgi:hypothetical protein